MNRQEVVSGESKTVNASVRGRVARLLGKEGKTWTTETVVLESPVEENANPREFPNELRTRNTKIGSIGDVCPVC